MNEVEANRPKRKQPRKISPRYLENAALFHLKRYACSVKQLRTVLLRKVRRSLKVHGGELDQATKWIDELTQKLERNGLLDDASFARMKAESLRRGGKSQRVIAMKLKQKGLSSTLVAANVAHASKLHSEEDAAWVHARKKRLGPFRLDSKLRSERRMKDLASLARAGFPYAIARKVIDGEASEAR